MANGSTVSASTLLDYAAKFVVAVLVPWAIWLSITVVEITANRFTASDGLEITRAMIDMERSLRADMPPQEWRTRIIAIENRLLSIEQKMVR